MKPVAPVTRTRTGRFSIRTLRLAAASIPERRPYRAHLTLARKVGKAPRSQAIEAIQWPVNEFCLVQSRTLPTGAEYAVLRTWPLS